MEVGFVLIMLGGSSMIIGWSLYHFFETPFMESIKFVILGILFIWFSFIVDHDKHNSVRVSHEN